MIETVEMSICTKLHANQTTGSKVMISKLLKFQHFFSPWKVGKFQWFWGHNFWSSGLISMQFCINGHINGLYHICQTLVTLRPKAESQRLLETERDGIPSLYCKCSNNQSALNVATQNCLHMLLKLPLPEIDQASKRNCKRNWWLFKLQFSS